jgi:transcriptional regulator with XRE-family HTH domain
LGKYSNEIEQFIYEICYRPMWEATYSYIAEHPYALDLTYSRIKNPDSAMLEDMVLEFPQNIRVNEDSLLFDAVVSCTIDLTEENFKGIASHETSQWLIISCEAVVTDRLEALNITGIRGYSSGLPRKNDGQTVTKNIVPIVYKKDLDAEAATFLRKYYPKAMEEPCPVPISDIAETMGLEILQGNRITDDFSIFGEIFFSAGKANVYDLFKSQQFDVKVRRGTILIDAYTFWERNLGCVNNTIAHEIYHWYKHRMYAAIRDILHNEKTIACRCPSVVMYPGENEEWTDEQRMEWQANSVAPRILMPIETFKTKVNELYKQYDYEGSPIKNVVVTCVADDLASFYHVSRQSALIRMEETGYYEATSVLNRLQEIQQSFSIGPEEGYLEYIHNDHFREIVDSGLFRFVNGYYVINDEQYIATDADDKLSLTEYAWENLDSCTIPFVMKPARFQQDLKYPGLIMHRAAGFDKLPQLDEEKAKEVLKLAKAVFEKKQTGFELQKETMAILSPGKTCCQMLSDLFDFRHITKYKLEELTGLGSEVYSKARNGNLGNPTTRTIVAIACGLDLDLDETECLMKAAGRSFTYSNEDRALKYCIFAFIGHPIDDANDFLTKNGFEPLGTKQRH